MKRGFDIIIKNCPNKDNDVVTYSYQASKAIENLLRRVSKLLEAKYIDKEFYNIVRNLKKKEK